MQPRNVCNLEGEPSAGLGGVVSLEANLQTGPRSHELMSAICGELPT